MKNKILIILIILLSLFSFGCQHLEYNIADLRPKATIYPAEEYEVLSVKQYIEIRTNGFGAVMGQNLAYAFTYIDQNGNLTDDTISHSDYGLWKVAVGKENKYVEQRKGVDTYRILYLTEETLKGMNNYEKRN